MLLVNSNFCRLRAAYLFTEIQQRTDAYVAQHPDKQVIRLGIGDVRGPLASAVIEAMQRAVAEQADARTFHGYGLEQGAEWMRRSIVDFDYRRRVLRWISTRCLSPMAQGAIWAT